MRRIQRTATGINKLYVLVDSRDKVMAISEDEALMAKYVVQFSQYFQANGSAMYVENDTKKIEQLLIRGDLMILQPLSHFVFTEMECEYYNAIFRELYENYKSAVSEMISFSKLVSMDDETNKALVKGIGGVVNKLQSYEEFIDDLQVEAISEHILIKPYMAKFYYSELSQLKERFTYDKWRD